MPDLDALARSLEAEGYRHVFLWRDGPHAIYPDHTHPTETAHLVIDGEITVSTRAGSRTYRTGDRFDVPAGEVHSARIGPFGCTYLVGER
jgi:mannose-6-phosphate isomerase-like protein (cupin superfamily)